MLMLIYIYILLKYMNKLNYIILEFHDLCTRRGIWGLILLGYLTTKDSNTTKHQ